MRVATRSLSLTFLAGSLLVGAAPLGAQTLTDFCPDGDPESEAAIVGIVTDAESETILPAADVAVSWLAEGTRRRVAVSAGLDGVYTVCGLPQGLDMQVRANFGDRRSPAVDFSTATVLQQFDLAIALTGEPEEEEPEVSEAARTGRAFNATTIRGEDLAPLPDMTVYQLLRQHQRLRFERVSGGEVIIFAGRGIDGVTNLSGSAGRYRGIQMFINERREADPVSAIRGMSIYDIVQIDILSAGEASARYGGDGWLGAISIRTRER